LPWDKIHLFAACVYSLCVFLSVGCIWCLCRNISVKPGGLKPKTVPPRYLGQPSPFTHPHLIKHGEYCLQWTADLVKCHFFIYFFKESMLLLR
uniref:Uncharacterized protein n=1 Tax=Oreochromis aureus TaxID=47969 RepID=A0A668RV46_OREAU